jgi:hypothetical protein
MAAERLVDQALSGLGQHDQFGPRRFLGVGAAHDEPKAAPARLADKRLKQTCGLLPLSLLLRHPGVNHFGQVTTPKRKFSNLTKFEVTRTRPAALPFDTFVD